MQAGRAVVLLLVLLAAGAVLAHTEAGSGLSNGRGDGRELFWAKAFE